MTFIIMSMNSQHFTVIMAGGVGSRFWPMSTKNHPKQFLDVLNTGKSLIRSTFERFQKITPTENILVVTNEQYRDLVKKHIPELDNEQILGEPVGKNTAPCIAYAKEKIRKKSATASMVVAPSDHIIRNEDVFVEVVTKSLNYALDNPELVTLGIEPTRADTGYGYINYQRKSQKDGFYPVNNFTEKPNQKLAQEFVESGDYLWNAGIFVWSLDSIDKAFEKNLSEMNSLFADKQGDYNTANENKAIEDVYAQCENISIDYGIMEKADKVSVYPAPFDWSDVGTWNALYDIREKDDNSNVISSKHQFIRNSEGCLVHLSSDKLVALNGVKDLVIVESDSAIMVIDRNDEQAVKEVVNSLKKENKIDFV